MKSFQTGCVVSEARWKNKNQITSRRKSHAVVPSLRHLQERKYHYSTRSIMEMEKPKDMLQPATGLYAELASNAPKLSSVEDLERRLKLLGNTTQPPPAAPAAPAPTTFVAPAPAAVAAPSVAKTTATTMGGKAALLARIQAAKAKSVNTKALSEPKPEASIPPPPQMPPEMDLLSGFDAPSQMNDPPPVYDTNFLPPPAPPAFGAPPPMFEAPPPMFEAPPPIFDPMHFTAPPPLNSVLPPPPPMEAPMYMLAPPAASAPDFEDLMVHAQNQQQYAHEQSLLDMPSAMMPPPAVPEIDEDILAALDPAERAAILEEQRKIMQDIEHSKQSQSTNSAAARAMAFDQRSGAAVARVAGQFDSGSSTRSRPTTSTQRKPSIPPPPPSSTNTATSRPGMVDLGAGEMVPLHGQEKTQEAIRDGTARIVQCLNCQNWMQVTHDATLMLCPSCGVVSPVLLDEGPSQQDLEQAAQMSADAQLAEKLQAEEYGAMEEARARQAAAAAAKQSAKAGKAAAAAGDQSWYDWFMGSSSTQTSTSNETTAVPSRGSAELPSRTAGGSTPPRSGLIAASTGEEAYGRYDPVGRGGVGGGGARVAESKGMFSCVADAVGSAVFAMNQDEDGNVHGVDSSGLLAMPNVSRQRE